MWGYRNSGDQAGAHTKTTKRWGYGNSGDPAGAHTKTTKRWGYRNSEDKTGALLVPTQPNPTHCNTTQPNPIQSRSLQCHFRVTSGSCQGHFRVTSGSLQGHVRVTSRSLQGSCQGHFKVISGLSASACSSRAQVPPHFGQHPVLVRLAPGRPALILALCSLRESCIPWL